MTPYRKHSRPVPLRVPADIPANVDVTACAADNSSSLCVFAVNPRREPVDIVLDLSDFGPGFTAKGGEVVRDVQARKQIDIINSFTGPDRVRPMRLEIKTGNIVTIPALAIAAIECSKD
jgi:hypothetical protein